MLWMFLVLVMRALGVAPRAVFAFGVCFVGMLSRPVGAVKFAQHMTHHLIIDFSLLGSGLGAAGWGCADVLYEGALVK
jgi:hypothetical protein